MKAGTKKNIGEVTAWIVVVIGTFVGLTKFLLSDSATNGQTFEEMVNTETGFVLTPKEASIGDFVEFLGFFSTLSLSVIYAVSLHKKKIRATRIVYRIWWLTLLIPFCLIFIGSLVAGIGLTEFCIIALILVLSFLPFGIVTFLYWVGLKGLMQMVEVSPE